MIKGQETSVPTPFNNLPPRFSKTKTAAGSPPKSTYSPATISPPLHDLHAAHSRQSTSHSNGPLKPAEIVTLPYRRLQHAVPGGALMVWYESSSDTPITGPASIPTAQVGDCYVHYHHSGHQAWVKDTDWIPAWEGLRHPAQSNTTLHIRASGEPVWYSCSALKPISK